MAKRLKRITYTLRDQAYKPEYPEILLSFARGERRISKKASKFLSQPTKIKDKFPNLEDVPVSSVLNPIGCFCIECGLDVNTARDFYKKYPEFRDAVLRALTLLHESAFTSYIEYKIIDKDQYATIQNAIFHKVDHPAFQRRVV